MTDTTSIEYMKKLLQDTITHKASDLHLIVGRPPQLRVDGDLNDDPGEKILENKDVVNLVKTTLREDIGKRLVQSKEVDYSFSFNDMRIRANAYYESGNLAAAFRIIPSEIPTIEQLGLPPILTRFTVLKQGFVVITGPTGHGKSTTLASMIDQINATRKEHILTIEDPIEYLFKHKQSIISQRELGVDTNSFPNALRAALREDPNVILVGEMRDLETIEAALTLAETGHLVFSTLHTNDAAQTPDRMIDVFPEHKQQQVRLQLANSLSAIISQRLLPKINGGRVAAIEVLIANTAVKNLIREGKTHQLNSVLETSAAEGMVSLDKVLADLVSKGNVSLDDALPFVKDQQNFKTMVY